MSHLDILFTPFPTFISFAPTALCVFFVFNIITLLFLVKLYLVVHSFLLKTHKVIFERLSGCVGKVKL